MALGLNLQLSFLKDFLKCSYPCFFIEMKLNILNAINRLSQGLQNMLGKPPLKLQDFIGIFPHLVYNFNEIFAGLLSDGVEKVSCERKWKRKWVRSILEVLLPIRIFQSIAIVWISELGTRKGVL